MSTAFADLRGQHPLWAEIWSSEKVDFCGCKLARPALLLVDQSSLGSFRQTHEELMTHWFSDFGYLDLFLRYLGSKFEVVQSVNFGQLQTLIANISDGDIQNRKTNVSSIPHAFLMPNFARFWPHFLRVKALQILGPLLLFSAYF